MRPVQPDRIDPAPDTDLSDTEVTDAGSRTWRGCRF